MFNSIRMLAKTRRQALGRRNSRVRAERKLAWGLNGLDRLEDRTLLSTAPLVSEFPIRTHGGVGAQISAGPAGSNTLWFTLPNDIGEVDLSTSPPKVVEWHLPTYNSGPKGIAPGQPGSNAVYFVESTNNAIGKIDITTGTVTEYPLLATANAGLALIVTTPDGMVWFTEQTANKIGRLDPTNGTVKEFDIPTLGSAPLGITYNSKDRNLWFTEQGANQIGSLDPLTLQFGQEIGVATGNANLAGITASSDGKLWFTEPGISAIGSYDPASKTKMTYTKGIPANTPFGAIAAGAGSDHRIYFRLDPGYPDMGVLDPTATTPTVTQITGSGSGTYGTTLGNDGNIYTCGQDSTIKQVLTATQKFASSSITYWSTYTPNPADILAVTDSQTGQEFLWVTDPGSNTLDRFDPITHFVGSVGLKTAGATPGKLTLDTGTSGNPKNVLNFTENIGYPATDLIGQLDLNVKPLANTDITLVPSAAPSGIVYNPNILSPDQLDGTIWFTETGKNVIGRITDTGAVKTFNIPTANSGVGDIIVDGNGILWFVETRVGQIGKYDPVKNSFLEYKTPDVDSTGLVYNKNDKQIWFSTGNSSGTLSAISSFDPGAQSSTTGSNLISASYALPQRGWPWAAKSVKLAVDPTNGGDIWFTENVFNSIGGGSGYPEALVARITDDSSHIITEYPTPNVPDTLTVAPDGNVYYTVRHSLGSSTVPAIGIVMTSAASAPTQLAVDTPPPSHNAVNQSFGLVISAENFQGQLAPDYTGKVTISLGNDPTAGKAILSGTLTAQMNNGKAVFAGLSIDQPGAGFTIVANTKDGLTSVATAPFDVAQLATHLVFTVAPYPNVVAGSAFELDIAAEDDAGLIDPTFNGSVTVSLGNNPGSDPFTTVSFSATNGVATLRSQKLVKLGVGYAFVASSGATLAGTSPAFDVVAGQVTTLQATATTSIATAGTPFDLTVAAFDQLGNPVTTLYDPISFTLTPADSGSNVPSTYTFLASDRGTHTFKSVVLTKSGNPMITVTDNSVSPAVSGTLSLTVSPATVSSLQLSAPTMVTAGVPYSQNPKTTVNVLDSYGNLVTGYSGTVHFSSNDSAATLPPDYTFKAGDAGTHTFTPTLRTLGTQTVTVADTAINSLQNSQTVNVVANPTTTSLAPQFGTATYGDSLTFKATVVEGVAGGDPYTGTVQYVVDGNPVGSLVNLDSKTETASIAVTGLAVGSHTIRAIYSGDSEAASSQSTDYSFMVVQAKLIVQANSYSRAYGVSNPTFGVTYTGFVYNENSGVLQGTVNLSTTATVTSPVGTYPISASGTLSAANYLVSYLPGVLTVTPAALVVHVDPNQIMTYGSLVPALTYTTTGLMNGDTLSGSPATTASSTAGVGTYDITKGTLSAGANYAMTFQGDKLTVTAASLTVTADTATMTYGASVPALTYKSTGLLNNDKLSGTLSTSATSKSIVGTYDITQGSVTAGANYFISYSGAKLTVNSAALNVSADPITMSYGSAVPALTYQAVGLVNGDAMTGSLATTASSTSSIGQYPITQGTLSAGGNYSIQFTGNSLKVVENAVFVTANPVTMAYGDKVPNLTYLVTGLTNNDTLSGSLATTATSTSNVGSYDITQGTLSLSSNYTLVYKGAKLSVTAAALAVAANPISMTYGSSVPTLTYATTGLVNGDTLAGSLATTATSNSSVGTYNISQGTLTASSNYTLTFTGSKLTVNAAGITITANPATMVYGSTVPALTYQVTGLVNGDHLTGSLTSEATSKTKVGSYPINLGSLSAISNYAIQYTGNSIAVTPADFTIKVTPGQSMVYGDNVPTLSYSTVGLVNGDQLSGVLATTATSTSRVGNYAITQGTLSSSSNYVAHFTPNTLAIRPASLIVTADNQASVLGHPLPAFTVHYTGFRNGDTSANLQTLPTVSSTATSAGPVGVYLLTVSGGSAQNYSLALVNGFLTISPAVQPVAVQPVLAKTKITAVTLTFSDQLYPASATNMGNFTVVTPGSDGKYGSKDDKKVVISSISYNVSTRTITITFKTAVTSTPGLQLKANNLLDLTGGKIDGARNGQPGSTLLATIKGKNVKF